MRAGPRHSRASRRTCGPETSAFRPAERRACLAARRTRRLVLTREPHAVRREPVQMPGGFADLGNFPRGVEQLPFREAHENGIQRAGFQPRVPADVVAVFPVFRSREKGIEDLKGLRRQSRGRLHATESIYVECACQLHARARYCPPSSAFNLSLLAWFFGSIRRALR